MKQEIKGKPHFKGILDLMAVYLKWMLDSSHELRNLKLVGDILGKGDLPKKETDVYYIIERLEKMIRFCTPINRLGNTQDYLITLVQKIRAIFFKTRILMLLKDKGYVKIILNNETEVVIGSNLQALTDNFIVGITLKREEVEIDYSNIKTNGILPLTVKEIIDIKMWKKIMN